MRAFLNSRRSTPAVAVLAVLSVVVSLAATAVSAVRTARPAPAALLRATAATSTTATPASSTTEAPPATAPPSTEPPTTAAPAPPPTARAAAAPALTPAPAPRAASPRVAPIPLTRPSAASIDAYNGMGTWLDVYDWSATFAKGGPPSGLADIDRMADVGVQTLYIQASKHDAPTDVLEPDTLNALIDRAHQRGMRVVAWYLPTLVDPGKDLQRLVAIAALDVDGLAVDIEARNVSDTNDRNRRLIELSSALRQALPGRALGAIVLPPVVLEVVNPSYWPSFPYREIAPSYDVWMTMGYWTNRRADSGYRDAHRYTAENVSRLRANVGRADLPVHPIGGIGDQTTPADVDGFLKATVEQRGLGGSLYDWRTTKADAWPGMQRFRTPA